MTDTRNGLTIERLLAELNKSYKGIDLRVVLAKARETSDNEEWVSVFLKMLFTNKKQDEIKRQHKDVVARVGDQDDENLKVKLVYHGIKEALNLINCISRGHIPISSYLATIQGGYREIKTKKAVNNGFTNTQNICKMICSGMNPGSGSVVPFLESMVGKQNIDLEKISELLDIRNLQSAIENNIVILFPLFSKKIELQDTDKGRILRKYEIDRNLVKVCKARVTISVGDVGKKYRLPLNKHIDQVRNNMAYVSIPIPKGIELSPHDYINIEIWHRDFGDIQYKDDFSASEVMQRQYYKDPLMESFKLFTASDLLKEYLLRSGTDEKKQMAVVSWLLAIVGFQVVVLGMADKKGESIKNAQPNRSCDILAGSDGNIEALLTIDCTSNVPDEVKIKKISNTATSIGQEMKTKLPMNVNVPAIPVLISFVDCSVLKSKAAEYQVRLIDRSDLDNLYDLVIEKGLRNDAAQMLDSILGIKESEIASGRLLPP